MSKWVHVIDELPERGPIVIVWDGYESKLAFLNNEERWCMPYRMRVANEPNITHWKPLPKPPNVQNTARRRHEM